MKGDICKVEGCATKTRTGKTCEIHSWRMRKHGSYEKPSRKRFGDICRAEGCEKLRDGRHSVCPMHRSRISRYKSLDIPIFNYPEGIVFECKIHGYLTIDQSYKNPKYGHFTCIECRRENDKKFIKNNPNTDLNKYKNFYYLGKDKKIKVNKEQYKIMFKNQNGLCAICNKEEISKHPFKKYGNSIKRLAIDHCHKTGKIRKLLCQMCNTGLGSFKDSIDILKSAIIYLEKHANNQKELIDEFSTKNVTQASPVILE